MGYRTAADMNNMFDLEKAIGMHFAGNCYPPIPQIMVEVGVKAIQNVVEAEITRDGDLLDEMIQLPKDETGFQITFRGSETVSSIDAIEGMHLEAFVDSFLTEEE